VRVTPTPRTAAPAPGVADRVWRQLEELSGVAIPV